MPASKVSNPAAGIAGDVLIARRARSVCVGCGLMAVVGKDGYTDAPYLCAICEQKRPRRRRFDPKAEKERGIANLDRLVTGRPLFETED